MIANDIITRAADTVHDTARERWTDADWLLYLNDGERDVVSVRPEAYVSHEAVTLVPNASRQAIPATALRALDFTHNLGVDGVTPGKAIRVVPREILDAHTPLWHAATPKDVVVNCVLDTRDPRVFYIYPRVSAAVKIAGVLSVSPPVITSTGQAINLSDIFANALVNYCVFRALSKDGESAAAQLAQLHYQAYSNFIGAKAGVDASASPAATATRS